MMDRGSGKCEDETTQAVNTGATGAGVRFPAVARAAVARVISLPNQTLAHSHPARRPVRLQRGAQNRDSARRRSVLPIGLILEIEEAVALPGALIGDLQHEKAILPVFHDVTPGDQSAKEGKVKKR